MLALPAFPHAEPAAWWAAAATLPVPHSLAAAAWPGDTPDNRWGNNFTDFGVLWDSRRGRWRDTESWLLMPLLVGALLPAPVADGAFPFVRPPGWAELVDRLRNGCAAAQPPITAERLPADAPWHTPACYQEAAIKLGLGDATVVVTYLATLAKQGQAWPSGTMVQLLVQYVPQLLQLRRELGLEPQQAQRLLGEDQQLAAAGVAVELAQQVVASGKRGQGTCGCSRRIRLTMYCTAQ